MFIVIIYDIDNKNKSTVFVYPFADKSKANECMFERKMEFAENVTASEIEFDNGETFIKSFDAKFADGAEYNAICKEVENGNCVVVFDEI
jgi:hypothetical protein